MDVVDRARRYVEKLEPAVAGAGGHSATYHVAVVLVQGFALGEGDAWAILNEYNARCAPAWSEKELRHKLRQAEKASAKQGRGWLVGADRWAPSERVRKDLAGAVPAEVPKARYDLAALRKVAAPMRDVVDGVWLANRSWVDPATVDAAEYLEMLYDREKERVVVFSECNAKGMPVTQGEAVWPLEEVPRSGRHGVWYLAAPVDGKWRETGEKDGAGRPKLTRRSGACVVSWRWMVVESDEAPVRDWLGAMVRFPLQIAALYSSGGRSVHALVRTPARTKEEWDEFRDEIRAGLVVLGADPGCMSAVRLTRLPGCMREAKGAMQKLLYIDPRVGDARPICDKPVLRDVEAEWCAVARAGASDGDETRGQWIADGLAYYASRSERCRVALEEFERKRTI
jgi:hypothetical protein